MKRKFILVLFLGTLFFGITGCDKIFDDKEYVSYDELNEINNEIIEYFTLNGNNLYDNYSYNYVDIDNLVVVVGLLDNSEEEQEKFRKMVVDSELIKFEKGDRLVND